MRRFLLYVLSQLARRPLLTVRNELRVNVHRGRDATVPHLSLDVFGVSASLSHPVIAEDKR